MFKKDSLDNMIIDKINGVDVVRFGRVCYDAKGRAHEILSCYMDGNKWYSNYLSEDEANKVKDELAAMGIDTVIGPAAPYMVSGEYITSGKGTVGLYLNNSNKTKVRKR